MKPPNAVQEYKADIAQRLKVRRTEREPVVIDLPQQRPVTRSFMTPQELAAKRAALPDKETVERARKKNVGSAMVGNMNRANREGKVSSH